MKYQQRKYGDIMSDLVLFYTRHRHMVLIGQTIALSRNDRYMVTDVAKHGRCYAVYGRRIK